MQRAIIYAKDADVLNFLRYYFKGRKEIEAVYVKNLGALKRIIKASNSDIVIAESPGCLIPIVGLQYGGPVIAIVSKDKTEGVKAAMANHVEHYMIPPYYEYDLEYKLKIAAKKFKYIGSLYQQKADLEAITNLSYMLSSTLDPQEILYIIVKRLSEIINVTRCSIMSVSADGSGTIKVVSSYEDPSCNNLNLDLKKYPEIRKALNTKRSVVVKDAMRDPLLKSVRRYIKPIGIKSIVVVPIIFRSEVIGTLFLRTSRKNYDFSEREIKLFQDVANASANALNNAFLFSEMKNERAELERLAITDFLTGVYNIRYLYHRLDEEFSRAMRYREPISCIMIDIDYFKRVNDTYGHRTGDMVLREFAGLIKSRTRQSDVFARYGGEEFILILTHSDYKSAALKAEKIRDIVMKHHFKGIKRSMKITISLGISYYPHKKIKSKDDLISMADDALLKAKASGRNRMIVNR